MREDLFEHQRVGARKLAGRQRVLLADEPGLGKSRTALLAAMLNDGNGNIVVICPAIMRTQWYREAEAVGLVPMVDVVVMSYSGAMLKGQDALYAELQSACTIILDEVHALKNMGAKRTQMLLGAASPVRSAPYVYALSGTPLPKGDPAELWPLMASLFPGVAVHYGCRTLKQWQERFCVVQGRMVRGHWVDKTVGVKNAPLLRELLRKVMLRRTVQDVGLSLPPIVWQREALAWGPPMDAQLSTEHEALARAVEGATQAELDLLEKDPEVARVRRKLGLFKVPAILDYLRTQLEGSPERLVVFGYHRDVLRVLHDSLEDDGYAVVSVDGSTPQGRRDAAIRAFQSPEKSAPRVFLGQIDACKEGITLTAARRVILAEPSWTASTNLQAAHRVARIGQTANVTFAVMLALANTLDDAVVGQHYRELRQHREVFAEGAAQ